MQDIEFTIEDGRLYLLQTRSAKRTAAAAVKSAVAMVGEGLIGREEAVRRDRPGRSSTSCCTRRSTRARSSTSPRRGCRLARRRRAASVVFDADSAEQRGKAGESVILVRSETAADDIHGMIQPRRAS